MIYTKFYCDAEIGCSVNKQTNKFFIYRTISASQTLTKLYIKHLEYLKYI